MFLIPVWLAPASFYAIIEQTQAKLQAALVIFKICC